MGGRCGSGNETDASSVRESGVTKIRDKEDGPGRRHMEQGPIQE